MEINLIQNHPIGLIQKQKAENSLEFEKGKQIGKRNGNRQLNRGLSDGSYTSRENNVAAISFAGKGVNGTIAKGKDTLFDKALDLCKDHTAIAQNLVALILATTARPAAIMALPGKDNKEDKIYASGHAIASGVIGFTFSTLLMTPLDAAAKRLKANIKALTANADEVIKNSNVSEIAEKLKNVKSTKDLKELDLSKDMKKLNEAVELSKFIERAKESKFAERIKEIYKVENLKDLENSKAWKNVTKIVDMGPDTIIFGVLKAMLTVKLIKPILKYVFGIEKKPKEDVNSIQNEKVAIENSPNIEKAVGGKN